MGKVYRVTCIWGVRVGWFLLRVCELSRAVLGVCVCPLPNLFPPKIRSFSGLGRISFGSSSENTLRAERERDVDALDPHHTGHGCQQLDESEQLD